MRLTKTEFVDFHACDKSLWLRKNRPDAIDWPGPDEMTQVRMRQGYEIEDLARAFVSTWPDAGAFSLQDEFETEEGLYARADLVRNNEDGSIDIFEVKSSTRLKDNEPPDHITDATFQTIVAERSGCTVRSIYVVHSNKTYVREGALNVQALLVFKDVTQKVRDRYPKLEIAADRALAFLRQDRIDESFCDCRYKSKSNHCASFGYFNSDIESPSIYLLPYLGKTKAEAFVRDGLTGLLDVPVSELSARQKKVRLAAEIGEPLINRTGIKRFIDRLKWPLYFYDYETYSTPVPQADGHAPYEQMAVQFSIHRMEASGDVTHSEFLADAHGQQRELVEALRSSIGDEGSLIAWNMKFEKQCNKTLAKLIPEHADFLNGMSRRTVDLMDPFAADYVDIRFGGSRSIKDVLPVLCPDLRYNPDAVHDGGGAVAAWLELVESDDEQRQDKLRQDLLAYCELDTLAMVRIFEVLNTVSS